MTRFNERFQSDASGGGGGGGGATAFDTIYDLYDAIDNESFTGEWKISWTDNDYLDDGAIRGGVTDGEPVPHPFTQREIPVNICGEIWDDTDAGDGLSYTAEGYPKLDPDPDGVYVFVDCLERYVSPLAPVGFTLRYAITHAETADNSGDETLNNKAFGAGVCGDPTGHLKGLHLSVRWYAPGTDWVFVLGGNGSTNYFSNVKSTGGLGDQTFSFTAITQRFDLMYLETDYNGQPYNWRFSTEREESYPNGVYYKTGINNAHSSFSWKTDLVDARPYFFCQRGTGWTDPDDEISITMLTLHMPTITHVLDGTI